MPPNAGSALCAVASFYQFINETNVLSSATNSIGAGGLSLSSSLLQEVMMMALAKSKLNKSKNLLLSIIKSI